MQAEEKQSAAEASTSGRPFYTDECTAFVRGLQQDVEEGDLESLFADCGNIKAVRITRDPQTGQAKVVSPHLLPSSVRICKSPQPCPLLSCSAIGALLHGVG